MKRSKTLLTGLLILVATGLFAQSVEKTLVRSFNLQNAQEVNLQVDAPVDVQTWKQSIMRVQMVVKLDRGSESMLRSLVQAGRYNLIGKSVDGQYQVNVPGLAREVSINGSALAETISYIVFVPENVHVNVDSSTSAAAF